MCWGDGAVHRINAVVALTIPACTSSGAAEGTGKNYKDNVKYENENENEEFCSLTILVSLDDHGIRRLTLDGFEKRHQEEIVLCELPEVGQSIRFRFTVVHHYRHHVVNL